MMPNDEMQLDELLRTHFAGVRETDARQAPSFDAMLAQARSALADAVPAASVVTPPGRAARRWQRIMPWAVVAPLAVAAGLAIVWLQPNRAADREFERAVTEWTRTSERLQHVPTDGLLSIPGAELLRPLPSLGIGAGTPRRQS